jgi:hypothetical protein
MAQPMMRANWNHLLERLPSRVQPNGWLGPTLFTSEVHAGNVVTLEAFRPMLRGHDYAEALAIGSVRETQSDSHAVYAAFCADPSTGRIVLVDLDPPYRTGFVNSNIEAFVDSLVAFASAWPKITSSNEAGAALIKAGLRSTLETIDPSALMSDDAFWPTSLEEYTW